VDRRGFQKSGRTVKVIASLPAKDRRILFSETGARMGLPPFHIEKDFWVCWTISVLFDDSQAARHLAFRGGTSLSKCWGLIERFSEDIDLSISRAWFKEAKNPAQDGITKSEREKRLKTLRGECRAVVAEVLAPLLKRAILDLPEPASIEIEPLEKARDPFCIHIHYPASGLIDTAAYHRAAVKLELSGRAEGTPVEIRSLTPYAVMQFPELDPGGMISLPCVLPERTFWEKAALLHEQNTRPGARPLMPRQARHLYDLAKLWKSVATSNQLLPLFPEVIAHRQAFFDYTWVDYSHLSPTALKLIPPDAALSEWQADYKAMLSMFHSRPPDFQELLEALENIENSLRSKYPPAP
jgi:hypothetical protein